MAVSKATKKIAMERVRLLFKYAREDEGRAKRYAFLIRKIAAKAQLKLPETIKWSICRGCGAFLHGRSLSVRLNKKTRCVERKCLVCGRVARVPLSRKKSRKRNKKEEQKKE